MKEPNALIKYALDATVKQVNNKVDPTTALQKVAKHLDLSPEYIQRVGEALNVALHHNHFKTASDRSSDFPVADIPSVKREIFGATEKTQVKKTAEWFHNNFEDEPINYEKILKSAQYKGNYMMAKTASENDTPNRTSVKGMIKLSADRLSALERQVDELKTKRAGLTPMLEANMSALVKEMKKTASVRGAFEEIESQVYANHGEKSVPYLDLVYKAAGLNEERGVHDDKYQFFTDYRATQLFDNLFKVANAFTSTEKLLIEAEAQYKVEHDLFKEAMAMMAGNPEPKIAEYKMTEDLDPVMTRMREKLAAQKEEKSELQLKKEALVADVFKTLYDQYKTQSAKANPPAPVFQNTSNDNNERKHILQELIMTDPILSKEDPRKILGSYEQFLRIAPHAAQQKEVVRAHIRASLAGQSISPFDASQITDANMKLMNQHKMLTNEVRGLPQKEEKAK